MASALSSESSPDTFVLRKARVPSLKPTTGYSKPSRGRIGTRANNPSDRTPYSPAKPFSKRMAGRGARGGVPR